MKEASSPDSEPSESDLQPQVIPAINVRKAVLIADDIEMNREILGDLLQEDYDIFYAADGVETLQVLRDHTGEIDLVLLDLIMPNMSGREVIAEMQVDEELMSIPVIILTVDQEAELDCLRFGVFVNAKREPDPEERFARASAAAERIKDDPDTVCGYDGET